MKFTPLSRATGCPKTKSKLALLTAAGVFISVCVIIHYLPLRNYLLKSVLPAPWRDVTTTTIIKAQYLPQPLPHIKNPDNYICNSLRKPKTQRSSFKLAAMKTYPRLVKASVQEEVARKGHGQFMPVLNPRTKGERLYLYSILRDILELEGVQHFVTGGVLLGFVRYGSFLPWDDDIDAVVDVRHAEKVQHALSCVRGFSLDWRPDRDVARFHYQGRTRDGDPVVDILFFSSDSSYLWAVSGAMSVLHVYSNVFPVTTAVIEGVTFTLPRDPYAEARRIADLDTCCVRRQHVKPERSWAHKSAYDTETFRKSCEKCTRLEYMYPLREEMKGL